MLLRYVLFALLALGTLPACLGQINLDAVRVIYDYPYVHQLQDADIDSDGDTDIITSGQGISGHIFIHEHLDGQGQFAPPRSLGSANWQPGLETPPNFKLGDMDNDGDIDIIDERWAASPVPFWSNDGSGNFIIPTEPINTLDGYYYFELQIADFNNDGLLDILVYEGEDSAVFQLRGINWNQGAGNPFSFQEIDDVFFNPNNFFVKKVVLQDFNQDGSIDIHLIGVEKIGNEKYLVSWLYQQTCMGCFAFMESIEIKHLPSFSTFYSIDVSDSHSEDIDLDGLPDLSISYHIGSQTTPSQQILALLRNQFGEASEAIFSSPIEIVPCHSCRQHEWADLNADDLPELVASSHEGTTTYLNEGDFAFPLFPNYTSAIIPGTLTNFLLTKIDGDGFEDAVFFDDISVSWMSGMDNEGLFSPLKTLYQSYSSQQVKLLDWEEDGDLDLLLLSEHTTWDHWENGLFLLQNEDGQGHFSSPQALIYNVGRPSAQETADLDQDGQPDLFGSTFIDENGTSQHRLFVGLSSQSPSVANAQVLTETQLWTNIHGPFNNMGPVATDLDGDGDLDLLFVENENQDIGLVRNELSSGSEFEIEAGFISKPSTAGITWYFNSPDLDQDGDDDLLYGTVDSLYWAQHLDGQGTFSEWNSIATPFQYTPGRLLLGDFDGDLDLDINYISLDDNNVFSLVLLRFQAGQWAYLPAQISAWNTPVPYGPNYYSVTALPDSPLPGLVSSRGYQESFPSGYVTYPFLPTPFDDNYQLPLPFYANAQSGDVDGDGKLEMIAGTNQLIWYELDFLNNRLQGLLVDATNTQCAFDSSFAPLKGWNIEVQSEELTQLVGTNLDGHFGAILPPAEQHLVRPVPLSSYWEVCQEDSLLTNLAGNTTVTTNFSAVAVIDCPLLKVELVTSPIRQCFPSRVVIRYHNIGTQAVDDAQFTLHFDPNLTPVASAPSWTLLANDSLVYSFPSIGVGDLGQIIIDFEPACDQLQLGQDVCFELRAEPAILCDNMLWNGAQLEASTFCQEDSLAFRIQNTGFGAMDQPESYQVHIVNDDLVLFLNENTQLMPGEADTIWVPNINETVRFTMDQPDGHPFPEPISLLSNTCVVTDPTEIDDTYNSFPNNEGDPFFLQACQPVIGPYDPNIKVATPEGWGDGNWIEPDWAIDYTIHFQNTGTDLARTVILRDTLSPHLDLSSFRPGPASHAHEWTILPDRQLIVTFPEIMLPDSNSNEAASHGLFSYQIAPLADVAPLSVIDNRVGIYFDFNPPVLTDFTTHIVRKPRVETVEHLSFCEGDEYEGISLSRDTFLQTVFLGPAQDSIIWTYLTVHPIMDTTISIMLEEAGTWEGIPIQQDTTITRVVPSDNGCDQIIHYEFTLLTGLEPPLWAVDWQIGPNPVQDQLSIRRGGTILPHLTIRLIQADGRLALQQAFPAGQRELELQCHDLPAGTYFLELRQGWEWYRWVIGKI